MGGSGADPVGEVPEGSGAVVRSGSGRFRCSGQVRFRRVAVHIPRLGSGRFRYRG